MSTFAGQIPATAEGLEEMRKMLDVAPLQAMYAAARVAVQVRTDSDTILSHLQIASESYFAATPEAQLGRDSFILKLKIESWLADRQDDRRTRELREADILHRAQLAERVLSADDPQTRTYWESYYLEHGRDEEGYAAAVTRFRESLAKREWPDRMNFRNSLSSQNFATMLRRSSDQGEVDEGVQITARNATWRRTEYGRSHPFTMVAEGNRILDELYAAEATYDFSGRLGVDNPHISEVLKDAAHLTAARKKVLGAHHGGTVRAMSYQARAHRLLGQPDKARAIAEEALVLFLKHSSKNDTSITAVLRFMVAEGYIAEESDAERNAAIATSSGAFDIADVERERVSYLRRAIEENLSIADADLIRWPSQRVWRERVARLQSRHDDQ